MGAGGGFVDSCRNNFREFPGNDEVAQETHWIRPGDSGLITVSPLENVIVGVFSPVHSRDR